MGGRRPRGGELDRRRWRAPRLEVGEALRTLGAHHQILCVTHLPAIAAVATRHLAITREVHGGRTLTTIGVLDGDARVTEVADMIAGGADEKTARAEARRLLKAGKG